MFKTNEQINIITDEKAFMDVEYPIMEHFYTIQGEGAHSGRASYFIRTAGCDVNCWWCDVKESWEEEGHPKVKVSDLVQAAQKSGAPFVVITGGEPLLHNLLPLTLGLKSAGLDIHIETSGSSPLSGQLDWITLSPKRFKKPTEEVFAYVDELKVVVLTNKDLKWAEENAAKCPKGTRFLLQPEWETPESMDLIVDYVKENPGWGISLQTHKFLNVP